MGGPLLPKTLRPRHRIVMHRLLAGRTQTEICAELDYSPRRLSVVINSPLFAAEYNKLVERAANGAIDIGRKLQLAATQAADTLIETMRDAASPQLRYHAANQILDRAGFGSKAPAGNTVSVSVNNTNNAQVILSQSVPKADPDLLDRLKRLTDGKPS